VKILLVDDEEELVSALAERLSFRDIDADYATGGAEALDKVREKDYDLAVLDVKMPKIGGIKLKKEIKKIQPGMRFIFLTGHGSEEDFKAGSKESAAYLVKPVKIEDLISKMREALES